MTTLTIHSPEVAKKMVQSVLSFSSDMKLEADPGGCRVALKCDVPDIMRIEFRSTVMTATEPMAVCIKEALRVFRAIDLVMSERDGRNDPISLELAPDRQFLTFSEGSLQFKVGLVGENAILGCVDNSEFRMFSDEYSFRMKADRIKALFRQSSIVRSSEARVFLVNVSGKEIAAKLEDDASPNSGMVSVKVSDGVDSGEFSPLIVKSDTFKSLVKFPFEECTFHYTDRKAIIVEASYEDGGHSIRSRVMFSPKKARR